MPMRYIAIIDDSPTMRASVMLTLKPLGYNVLQAQHGAEGLDVIQKAIAEGHEIALTICDINMPVLDGIGFINEFRKFDKFTPILVLTTESEQATIQKGKQAGASGWLIKPFKPDELIQSVERLIR